VKRFRRLVFVVLLLPAITAVCGPYDELVAKDKPVAHWNSNPALTEPLLEFGATLGDGPRPPEFPEFVEANHAIVLSKPGASLRVADPGVDSIYDFKLGDSITLEAWVRCEQIGDGQNVYLVGKGRTGAAGLPPHNQNWGLRLREIEGTARVSFVFRDEHDATAKGDEFWHRWTSSSGLVVGEGWHHVAMSYTFGKPESVRGYLDGESVAGAWDMGGATTLGPWVDDDDVWIGTSMGGSAAASLRGRIDEVAIYRTALKAETLTARFKRTAPIPLVQLDDLPRGIVRVEILEHRVAEADAAAGDWTVNDSEASGTPPGVDPSWGSLPATKTEEWSEPSFALAEVVAKYSQRGVRRDRSSPYLVRMAGAVTLPEGENRLLIRAIRGGRLSVDGKAVATSAFYPKQTGPIRAADAEPVPDQLELQLVKETALLPPGHSEATATVHGDGKEHVVVFELFVGGKGLRPELGQPSVSISQNGAPFQLLACNGDSIDFTDAGWSRYSKAQRAHIDELAAQSRAKSRRACVLEGSPRNRAGRG
jgi:hypothetical protein